MGWTRWPMGTKTPFRLMLLRWMRTLMNCSALENPIRRKLSVGRHYEEFHPDKTTRRAVLQLLQHGLVGLGHRASQLAHLKRPYRVSRAALTALQLAGLVQIANTNTWREPLLLETNRAVGNYRGGFLRHGLGLDVIRGLFASQPSHFAIQSGYNARQPSHSLCWPLTWREAHLLGVLVPKQPLCEGPVPALYDPLVPVDVNPTAPNLNRVLCQQLAHRTHELAPRINLKELRPLQRPPSADPRQSIGDLCRGLASQRLSLFVAWGYIDDRENVAEGFPPYEVVWQKEQIRLVDLVGHRHVKLRPRCAPWCGQIDLPDGLPFELVLGLLLSHLCCRRQLLDGREPLPVPSGAVV